LRINQVKSGVMLSYASILLSTVISLIYTPIMLSHLGTSEYGVYNVVLPIISYLNLLYFGLGSAYVRYSLRAMGEHDHKRMAKLNGMFFSIYLILGTLILVIGSFLAYHGMWCSGKS
jgi:O-antigen/teichoic acid export membrane protein